MPAPRACTPASPRDASPGASPDASRDASRDANPRTHRLRRLLTGTALVVAAGATVLGLAGPASAAPASGAGTAPAVSEAPVESPVEQQVVALANQQRAAAGCTTPLVLDRRLAVTARLHSQDMIARGYVSHITPEGLNPFQRMAKQGYRSTWMGEVIGAGQRTPAQVVTAWLNSPAHRHALLDCRYRATGVGLAQGGAYGLYWTMVFGDGLPPVAKAPARPAVPAARGPEEVRPLKGSNVLVAQPA